MRVSNKVVWDSQKELANCSFIKTVLMITVVFYHCILFWTGTWFVGEPKFEAPVLSWLANWLNSFHIYGFALTSGYLFYFLKHEQGKYSAFMPFVVNKAKRLLLPYFFIAVVWVIPITQLFYNYTFSDIIIKYALGTGPSQLWFLLMLFAVFMIFYPLSDFFKKHTMYGAIVVAVIYGFGVVGTVLLPDIAQVFTACTYVPIFWAGFKLRQGGSAWLRKIHWVGWIVIDIFLFIVSQHLSSIDGMIFSLFKRGFDLVLHLTGALMAFAVLQRLADHVKWQKSKMFAFLAKNSMPVYLVHQQLVYLCIYWLNGVLNPYIHAAVNFICALGVSLLISALLMRFKLTRLLIGEK